MNARSRTFVAGLVAATTLSAPALAQELTIGLKSEATSMDPQFHQLSTNIQACLTYLRR